METLSSNNSKNTLRAIRILPKAAEEKLDRGQSVAHQEEISIEFTKTGVQFFYYIPSSICEPRLYLHVPSSIREPRLSATAYPELNL